MKKFLILVVVGAIAALAYYSYQDIQSNVPDNHFSGAITAYDTGCFADATCSVTVGDKKVILVTGGRAAGDVPVGQLLGVESIGDLEQKIGTRANVYAGRDESGDYTLYGSTEYFVQVY